MSRWLAVPLILVACSCGSEGPTLSGGQSPRYEPEMFRQILDYLVTEVPPEAGDWPEDFGDANYFGPGFFFRYGSANDNALQIALAKETALHDQQMVQNGVRKVDVFIEQLDHVMMAGLGLIEAHPHQQDDEALEQLDKMIDLLHTVARGFDFFPGADAGGGSYAIATYGSSTMNATLALLQLEYVHTIGGSNKEKRIKAGLQVLEKGRELGFDEQRGYYRFTADTDELYLYPNVTQAMAHVRAYQLTDDRKYLERAQALIDAIQPLKVGEEGRYRSPYSAKHMGAKTDDYTTLSSQNYTMIALALLYEATQKEQYKTEVLAILEFICTRLLQDGRALHHWMDGQLAKPEDPEYYCTGCNLQTLYLIWRLETFFGR